MLGNGIRHTTTTTGPGAITLVAVAGSPSFASVFGSTGTRHVQYAILTDDSGQPGDLIETGIGLVDLASLSMIRTPRSTWISGVYTAGTPSAVSLATGTKHVLCAPVAEGMAWPGLGNLGDAIGAPPRNLFLQTATSVNFTNGHLIACHVELAHPTRVGRLTARVAGTLAGATASSLELALGSIGPDGLPAGRLTDIINAGGLMTPGNVGGTCPPVWCAPGDYVVAIRAAWTGGTGTPNTTHGNVSAASPFGTQLGTGIRLCPVISAGAQSTIPLDLSALTWSTTLTPNILLAIGA